MRIEKQRVLLFAYDGTGLGHVMRLVKIASELKKDFVPLIATGHPAINNIIQDGIEFIRLPNFQSDFFTKTVNETPNSLNVHKFRNNILWYLLKTFKPHILITDFLPSGKKNELLDLIMNYNCIKYFIIRGEIGSSKLITDVIFTKRNNELIRKYYKRVFVACDKQITNLDNMDLIPDFIKDKFLYVGYVAYKVNQQTINEVRKTRLLNHNEKWIVCSAGGGRLGEELIKKCISLSKQKDFSNYKFDIIQGYYSNLPWDNKPYSTVVNKNVWLSKQLSNLHLLHAAADIVICSGGYNSITEAVQGRDKFIFSYSVQDKYLEQQRNIKDFKRFFPVEQITNLENLEETIQKSITVSPKLKTSNIDFNGVDNIKETILKDIQDATNF